MGNTLEFMSCQPQPRDHNHKPKVKDSPTKRGVEGFAEIATRGLLATDHVILNYGQVTWTTSEMAPPLLTTTPHQREDVSALDRFNVHRCPTRRVFSGTGIELVTRQATIRYLYHSATAAYHITDRSNLSFESHRFITCKIVCHCCAGMHPLVNEFVE
ncbi:uncharacterized protein TNCV_2871771 [Trichonephila clavipes]|nr:uncharacterized protein TNCV_2871771 [Trichonephila clavipes]